MADDEHDEQVGEPRTGDTRRAAVTLREVVALVDSGDLEATGAERAHLTGAADVLERLDPSVGVQRS